MYARLFTCHTDTICATAGLSTGQGCRQAECRCCSFLSVRAAGAAYSVLLQAMSRARENKVITSTASPDPVKSCACVLDSHTTRAQIGQITDAEE